MENINRTFLLGAGFSKAVADGPLMKELWSCIENAYEQEKTKPKGQNRLLWFKRLDNFINRLEEQVTYGFNQNEIGKIERNVEYLFTLIDLRLMGPKIPFKKEAKTRPYDPKTDDHELMEIKDYLLTYLYIIFERLKANHLADKFAWIIKENDEIITFNYDLSRTEKVL